MRPLLVLSLVVLTLPLFAFSGRPVSDLVVDDALSCIVGAAASDGDDFLVVCDDWDHGAWGQIIKDGLPAGPMFFIGEGSGFPQASAVWNGSSYIVSWCAAEDTTHAATISRSGAVGEPVKIFDGCGVQLAASGNRVLFVGDGRGALLDADGRPASPLQEFFSASVLDTALTATNDGFALATFGYSQTSVLLIDRDGKPRSAPIRVEGPYAGTAGHSEVGSIASDGQNVLLTFVYWQPASLRELRTAVVARNGNIVRTPKAVLTSDPKVWLGMIPRSLMWNGSEYLAGVMVQRESYGSDPNLLRINTNGDRIGEPALIAPSFYIGSGAIVSNGRENLIAGNTDGPKYLLAQRGASVPSTALRSFGRTPSPHKFLVLSAQGDLTLAVWTEKHRDKWQVRASRVDRSGRYLDGSGLLLDTNSAIYTIAADSDGTNWLVAWSGPGGGGVRGRRISPAGALLDAQPLSLGGLGGQLAIASGNGKWMVVTTLGTLYATPVRANGTVETRRTVAAEIPGARTAQSPNLYYNSPGVAFDGTRFVIAAIHNKSYDTSSDTIEESTIATAQVDMSGVPVGGAPVLIGSAERSPVAMAENGTSALVVFARPTDKLMGLLLPSRMEVEIANAQAGLAAATWDGSAYVVAFRGLDEMLKIARVSPQGTVSTQGGGSFPLMEMFPSIALANGVTGFIAKDSTWGTARASILFLDELSASAVPPPPVPQQATQLSSDVIRVQWLPATNALGVTIDLRGDDGSYRPIGFAAASAGKIDVSRDGLSGNAIRLRAWNAAGTSMPSNDLEILPLRRRAVR